MAYLEKCTKIEELVAEINSKKLRFNYAHSSTPTCFKAFSGPNSDSVLYNITDPLEVKELHYQFCTGLTEDINNLRAKLMALCDEEITD